MPIVTLTTDFGTHDFYAGALKGALLRRSPGLVLVDISHDIKPFDIVQGAFMVQHAWPEFPEGTIHILGVNCVYDKQQRFLVARRHGHFFVAPDNGLLTLLFPDWPEPDVRVLETLPDAEFPSKTAFAEATAYLVQGGKWEELGSPAGPLLQRIRIQPVITRERIRGTVLHVDNFDNAVVNITREIFEKVRAGRDFSLFFKRNDPISRLCQKYSDAPVGEPLCLFNSAGYLEIAINLGRAATLLGLKVDDVVEVVFS
jgi:S-adenosylmethionine hydrolase